MKKTLIITLLFSSINCYTITAQGAVADSIPEKNHIISEQFEELIKKSSTYLNFKVIDKGKLSVLQKNIEEIVATYEKEQATQLVNVQNYEKQIKLLKTDIENLKKELEKSENERDSFSFLGILMTKKTYSALMWCLVILLGGLLGFYIFKFKKSNAITIESLTNLRDLEEEYEKHRKSSIEREQKVRRQLQDEINKNKDC